MSETVEAEVPTEEAPVATAPPGAPEGKYTMVGGYWVREFTLNDAPATEIVVSTSSMKRVVVKPLKMSEQFDLFQILSSSENPIYRNMATMAASVRGLSSTPLKLPATPVWFPKTSADLKKILDDLGDDGVAAILAVREATAGAATAKPEEMAKNSVGTPA